MIRLSDGEDDSVQFLMSKVFFCIFMDAVLSCPPSARSGSPFTKHAVFCAWPFTLLSWYITCSNIAMCPDNQKDDSVQLLMLAICWVEPV